MSSFPEYTAVVTLTPAQIKSLHTAPVLIAPGVAGTIVDIRNLFFELNPGTIPYTLGGGGTDALVLFTGSVSGGVPNADVFLPYNLSPANGFMDQTIPLCFFNFPWWEGPFVGDSGVPVSVIKGQGIYAYQFDANGVSVQSGANWTNGNGTLRIYITYAYIEA